ncbi:hypothetical protein niasHS_015131 [Heterodera schachtii]|uniref:Gustatory receptor n=1 Tax=Heterodera schachtii TaxID=97005 RepID=A0ABD2I4V5_HETSC
MANATLFETSFVNVCSSALFLLNLVLCTVQLPLSLLNISVLCRTSLLHRNLKFVLFTQSVLFCIYSLAQISLILVIFILGKEHWLDYKIILFFLEFPLLYINYIGHVLLIERFIATIFAKMYEHAKSYAFNITWFALITSFCVATAAQEAIATEAKAPLTFTAGVLATVCASMLISFFEIIAFSLLITHNLKLFMRGLQIPANLHNLSERYQLAENIRTGRQLAPTFLFHFINICGSVFTPFVVYFHLITDPILLNLIVFTYYSILSLSNALIEFTLMRRHPILRKNALNILAKFLPNRCFSNNRITDSGKSPKMVQRIDGQKRWEKRQQKRDNKSNEMTEMHFKKLKEQWQKNEKRNL